MNKITPSSKLTFGKHRGKKLRDLETSYLQWMVKSLRESDFCLWAQAAEKVLEKRKEENQNVEERKSLEQQADEILRNAGFKP